jgi:hypothetical protein
MKPSSNSNSEEIDLMVTGFQVISAIEILFFSLE